MAFKMRGMTFGKGTGSDSPKKATKEWQMSGDTGEKYDKKVTTRKNLFGRDRKVTKYYDPKTGEKLGKEVRVARGKNDPRADKVKTKKVNPGLYQSGGVGKIRVGEGYFGGPGDNKKKEDPKKEKDPKDDKNETNLNRAQRAAQINLEEGGTFNVDFDPNNPRIESYKKSFAGFKVKDGKRWNPKKKKWYDDSEAGLKEYEDDSEAWWEEQARLTENEKLKKQNQEYGVDKEGKVKYSK